MSYEAKIVEVIRVVYQRGRGTDDDPIRNVIAHYTTEGGLIAEQDHLQRVPQLPRGLNTQLPPRVLMSPTGDGWWRATVPGECSGYNASTADKAYQMAVEAWRSRPQEAQP